MIGGVRDEDDPSPGELDWTHGGDAEVLSGSPHPRGRWRLWWVALAAAASALIFVPGILSGGWNAAGPTLPRSSVSAGSVSPGTTPASAGVTSTAAPAVTVTEVGHPLLGITADWDLFARGTATLVHIEFARGRITRTVLPGLASSGAVSFLAAPHAAIIRPWDFVPGYLVPDGQPPRVLTGALSSGGVLLPGPTWGQFWMQSGPGGITAPMALIGADGQPIPSAPAARLTIPPTMTSWPAPDGAGYPMATGLDGVYDLRPAGPNRITSGVVLAVGPTRWLAVECTQQARCSLVAVDQATGARHALSSFSDDPAGVSGVISPEGRTAALLLPDATAAGGSSLLHLIDLSTGADRRLALAFNQNASAFPDDALVWSPDGKWLFATDVHGQLHAVNPQTGQDRALDASLPPVEQLVIR
jgi:hypothetical protein